MEKETVLKLLEDPLQIQRNMTNDIQQIIERYPYFQSLGSVYLKLLYTNNHPLYNLSLKKVAAQTADRAILFDFITQDRFEQLQTANSIKEFKDTAEEDDFLMDLSTAEKITDPHLFEQLNLSSEKDHRLKFDTSDQLSFNEWLKVTQMKPVKRETQRNLKVNLDEHKQEKSKESRRKFDLIDDFLEKNPKIDAKKETGKIKKISPRTQPSSQLMTETLAKVYEEQKRYDKAIQAYNILILNNPEKSSLFANQIERIEQILEKEKK